MKEKKDKEQLAEELKEQLADELAREMADMFEKKMAEELAVELCSSIWTRFAPAADTADASHRWTTGDISNAIFQHTGSMVSGDVVFRAMKETGYRYEIDDTTMNVRYVWLLKLK